MASPTDLDQVLLLIKEHGLSVHVVRVGDIVLQLSKPWPIAVATEKEQPAPTEEQAMARELDPHDAQKKRLALLRELSKKQFGTVHPDALLEAMAPELLRGQAH